MPKEVSTKSINKEEFAESISGIAGQPLTYLWRGYGSAIFLECGNLAEPQVFASGKKSRHPEGEWCIEIEWSWRVEGKRRIWCGSWSDQNRWQRCFDKIVGQTITDVRLVGRLAEIDCTFSNGLHLVSAMTAEGDPAWAIRHRVNGGSEYFFTRVGKLLRETRRNA